MLYLQPVGAKISRQDPEKRGTDYGKKVYKRK